ncbi:hypothetical protein A7K99_17995 [Tatumella citrea]|uniref:histidine kinase n=1 Tax=Tatumella citrea TaxID=53336 RepID=A0A1Y0LBM2_TATCI|nr:hypothetical protein A7K98_18010 [Tatumella citrea]ARU99512.1 hypothetical protein A7K99_17995 [Tatumella citrea]
MKSLFKTTYFRMSFIALLVSALCIVILSLSVYYQARNILIVQNDQAIFNQVNTISMLPIDKMIQALNNRLTNDYRQVFYGGVFDSTGEYIAGNITTEPPRNEYSIKPYRARIAGIPNEIRMVRKELANGDVLYFGVYIKLISEMKLIIFTATLTCLAFMSLGAGIIGVIRSVKTVRDLMDIQEITRVISQGDFRQRIHNMTGNNEIDTLVEHINIMLEDIEKLTGEIYAINKNISHNLFSPLIRLRGVISEISQLAAINTGKKEQEVLSIAESEIEMILKRFSALQRISSIESRTKYSGMSFFHLSELKNDIEEIFEPYSVETGTKFEVLDSDGFIYADKGLLFEAIFNLVENSFKYCPSGSIITLIFSSSKNKTNIVVQDNGNGITDENYLDIINRYSRADGGYDVSGTGIGLSIVSSVARLHGFELQIENLNPGLKVALIAENSNYRPSV